MPAGKAAIVAVETPRASRVELPALGFFRADTERKYTTIICVKHTT